MRTHRILAALFAVSVVLVVACGDHVVVPPDKTGECSKGLLTKCSGDCVDLQTSLTNCGKCGTACNVGAGEICSFGKCSAACPQGSTRCGDKCVDVNVDRNNCGMCNKACAANEVCAKGNCAQTCEAYGYMTCSGATTMVDAGTAKSCVDPLTDNANCGTCGNVCSGMLSCQNGACCVNGQTGCNGTCISLQTDANNCGTCGNVCGMMAPNCIAGTCSKCKADILILGDSQTGVNQQMANVFKNAGFRPTVVDGGGQNYSGMPAATDFSAILVIPGNNYNTDMPVQGQQAIVAAQAAGVGVVFDGFAFYNANFGRYQTLKSIMLMAYAGGGGYSTYSVSPVGNSQPWFAGIAGGFGFAYNAQWFSGGSLINNGMTVANNTSLNFPAEAFRASPNGRIVQFSWGINYQSVASAWIGDPNIAQWTVNAVRYAAGCTQ